MLNKKLTLEKSACFIAAFLLCLTGLLGIVATGDAFNIFVFLEISSLSSYVLIALGKNRKALTASYQYLIMGTIGATFILIGVGLLYMLTGTLNICRLASQNPQTFRLAHIACRIRIFYSWNISKNSLVAATLMVTECLRLCALHDHCISFSPRQRKYLYTVLFRFFFSVFQMKSLLNNFN